MKLEWSDDPDSEDDEEDVKLSRKGSTKKAKNETLEDNEDEELEKGKGEVDIMAQQLKFIACLKIMMEELATLATGFEVDGGLLR